MRLLQRFHLPNGQKVLCYNRPEAEQFYSDIFEKQIYTTQGLELRPGDIVLDVGANIGMFTMFAGRMPGTKVYAIEPAPETFALLKQNVEANGVNAHCLNLGLGAQPGVRQFTHYPRSSGMSSFYGDQQEESQSLKTVLRHSLAENPHYSDGNREELMSSLEDWVARRLDKQVIDCKLETVSQVISRYQLDRVDFLKIDVQKSELDVLLGIERAHWPCIRQIAMEVHDISGRVATVESILKSRGYNVTSLQDSLYEGTNHVNVYAARMSEGPVPRRIGERAILQRRYMRGPQDS